VTYACDPLDSGRNTIRRRPTILWVQSSHARPPRRHHHQGPKSRLEVSAAARDPARTNPGGRDVTPPGTGRTCGRAGRDQGGRRVGRGSEHVHVMSGVVDLAQRQAVRLHRIPASSGVGIDVRSVQQFAVRQIADGATGGVSQHHLAGEHRLVQPAASLGNDVRRRAPFTTRGAPDFGTAVVVVSAASQPSGLRPLPRRPRRRSRPHRRHHLDRPKLRPNAARPKPARAATGRPCWRQ
jgi:hypothetical protein